MLGRDWEGREGKVSCSVYLFAFKVDEAKSLVITYGCDLDSIISRPLLPFVPLLPPRVLRLSTREHRLVDAAA